MKPELSENMKWIAAGNTGCTFATLFARKPESVAWKHMTREEYDITDGPTSKTFLASVEFPSHWNNKKVREWALKRGYFYEVDVDEECIGLRFNIGGWNGNKQYDPHPAKATTWVQYFGPDSHVVTRQTPNPMIMYTRRLNPLGYFKQVGWTGILHLAHAFSKHISERMADTLWNRSYEQVCKKIGHKPTIKEAAKTTWLKKDVL